MDEWDVLGIRSESEGKLECPLSVSEEREKKWLFSELKMIVGFIESNLCLNARKSLLLSPSGANIS